MGDTNRFKYLDWDSVNRVSTLIRTAEELRIIYDKVQAEGLLDASVTSGAPRRGRGFRHPLPIERNHD